MYKEMTMAPAINAHSIIPLHSTNCTNAQTALLSRRHTNQLHGTKHHSLIPIDQDNHDSDL